MRHALLIFLLLPVVSGCLGEDSAPQSAPTSSTQLAVGSLAGVVTDAELRPIEGATVNLRGPSAQRDATTDALGAFRFDDLVASTYVVNFDHPRHAPVQEIVAVRGGFNPDLEVAMELRPEHRPYQRVLSPMRGYYDCAAEAVIMTGDCLILYENITKSANPVTTSKNWFTANVSAGWTTILMELHYTTSPNNRLDGMRFYLALANESRRPEEHHTKVAIAEGPENPLRIQLERGVPHPAAESWKAGGAPAQLPATGGELLTLIYPRGIGAEHAEAYCSPSEPDKCFLGVGAGVQVDFTAYGAIFYNGAVVPADFSFAP